MTTLPTEIITEILSFLPAKSLCRFKSVAKSWYSLINSDTFIKLHLSKTLISDQPPNLISCQAQYSPSSPGKLIYSAAVNPNEIIFSVVDHPVKYFRFRERSSVNIIGSCCGILCIYYGFKKQMLYFNPSTKTHRLIPPAPTEIPATDDHIVVYGFGYDSSVNDYKLLRIIERRVYICREVSLYSMRSNSWKFVKVDSDDYPLRPMNAVHVNGVLYFSVSDKNYELLVKCFDLKTEEFSVFHLFEIDKSFDRHDLGISELGGYLAGMANYYSNKSLSAAELWVRKEASWVRVFRVSNLSKIRTIHIKPIVYSKDGGRILLKLNQWMFYWFDWRSNEFTRVWARGLSIEVGHNFYPCTFVPSIVPLKSDDDKANDELKYNRKVVPRKNLKKRNLDVFLSTGSS